MRGSVGGEIGPPLQAHIALPGREPGSAQLCVDGIELCCRCLFGGYSMRTFRGGGKQPLCGRLGRMS